MDSNKLLAVIGLLVRALMSDDQELKTLTLELAKNTLVKARQELQQEVDAADDEHFASWSDLTGEIQDDNTE